MRVAVIDYNAGNTKSVYFALDRLGIDADFTRDHAIIEKADKVIFPGVGEASTTMAFLRDHKLDQLICSLTQPVLGICLGMQLLCKYSEENNTECLGIFDAQVKRFQPQNNEKVPHMGWNQIGALKTPLFQSAQENQHVYFVHSYYVETTADTSATCHYVRDFSAAMCRDNFYATQFHPEKSGPVGAEILKQFLNI